MTMWCLSIMLLVLLALVASNVLATNQVKSFTNITVKSSLCNQSTTNDSCNHNKTVPPFPPLCNQPLTRKHQFFVFYFIAVLITGIIGNSISILVIFWSRNLRSQVAFHFLASLAMADIGVSCFITSINVKKYLHNNSFCFDISVCYMYLFFDYFFTMASVTHLFIVAIDRFTAIKFPFAYKTYFTRRRAGIIIFSIWCYVALWASMGVFPNNGGEYKIVVARTERGWFCFKRPNVAYITPMAIIIYIVPMCITTVLYAVILIIAVRQAKIIRRQAPSILEPSPSTAKNNKRKNRRFKKDLRAAKTISVVFIAYSVCWIPHFMLVLIGTWDVKILQRFVDKHLQAYDIVSTVFHNVLPPLNSCLNPFIYFLLGKNFRLAFKDLLYKLLRKPRDNSLLYLDETEPIGNFSRKESTSSTTEDERKMKDAFNNHNNNNNSNETQILSLKKRGSKWSNKVI